jgi:hypothetical protein
LLIFFITISWYAKVTSSVDLPDINLIFEAIY